MVQHLSKVWKYHNQSNGRYEPWEIGFPVKIMEFQELLKFWSWGPNMGLGIVASTSSWRAKWRWMPVPYPPLKVDRNSNRLNLRNVLGKRLSTAYGQEMQLLCNMPMLQHSQGIYQNLLLGGRTIFGRTGDFWVKNVWEDSSGLVKQEGRPLSMRGPHNSPSAVSWITHVQIKIVDVARIIQTWVRERGRGTDGCLNFSALIWPPATRHFNPICPRPPLEFPFSVAGSPLHISTTRTFVYFPVLHTPTGFEPRFTKSRSQAVRFISPETSVAWHHGFETPYSCKKLTSQHFSHCESPITPIYLQHRQFRLSIQALQNVSQAETRCLGR